MMYLQRLQALAEHLITLTGRHYERNDDGSSIKPGEGGLPTGFGRNGSDDFFKGDFSNRIGKHIKKLPSKKHTMNPRHIVSVDVYEMGSKEVPCYLSIPDFVKKHPHKFKNMDDPYTYRWYYITMSNGRHYDVDYEDNEEIIEHLHIKIGEPKALPEAG